MPFHHPMQHPLLASNQNNLIFHFPIYLNMLSPVPGMSSPVPLPNSDHLSTQFKFHLLWDTFPGCLHAEVAEPPVCPLAYLPLASVTSSHSCIFQHTVTSLKGGVVKYEWKDFVNEWLNTHIPKEESNLVSSNGSIAWIDVWPPQVPPLKEANALNCLCSGPYW